MSLPVRRGFFLLEAAVALLVIGLVAGAALELHAAQLRAASRGPELLAATTLAQDRLTALRLVEPPQLVRVPDSLARGRFGPPFASFHWRTTVAHSRQSDLYDVRVDVGWSNGGVALVSRIYAPLQTEPAR